MRKKMVFATNQGRELAKETCRNLSISLGNATIGRFSDGEVKIKIEENVRDADVFIVGPTNPPAENLMELFLLAQAARRSSAGRVTLIPTYVGYNRQDRKDEPRVPVSSWFIFKMIEVSGVDRVLLFDLHSEATTIALDIKVQVDHLYCSAVALPVLRSLVRKKPFVVASPDAGGVPRAEALANLLGEEDVVIFRKKRKRANEIDDTKTRIIGDVKGKDILFVDDMIDTGGTICSHAKAAHEAGANDLYVYATHGLFSADAMTKLDKSGIKKIFVTNTIPQDARRRIGTKHVEIIPISIAPLLGQAIRRLNEGSSLSRLIPKQNGNETDFMPWELESE